MLYYKALTQGLSDLPGADPAIRAEIDAEAARDGWPALHAKLAQVDPVTAARLHATDAQRIQRALELYRLTGQPMSALLAREAGAAAFHRHEAAAAYLSIALEPADRAVLHARIAQRFDAMLAGGLLDEVEALRRRGDLSPVLPSIRCVGYRQAWAYLDGEIDMATLREQASPPRASSASARSHGCAARPSAAWSTASPRLRRPGSTPGPQRTRNAMTTTQADRATFTLRSAAPDDCEALVRLIGALAEYEN